MCCEEYSTESSSIIELSAYSREFEKKELDWNIDW